MRTIAWGKNGASGNGYTKKHVRSCGRNGLLRDTYPRVRYAESKETVAALPDTAHGGKEGAKYLWQILHGIFEVYVSRRV